MALAEQLRETRQEMVSRAGLARNGENDVR